MREDQKPPAATKPEEPLRAYSVDIAKELLQPNMTETLLNAQLAEALFLVRDAGFLYRNSQAPSLERGAFIDHSQSLISASVSIADCIARLKGAVPPVEQKRIHYLVEHVQGGGGRPKPENE